MNLLQWAKERLPGVADHRDAAKEKAIAAMKRLTEGQKVVAEKAHTEFMETIDSVRDPLGALVSGMQGRRPRNGRA